MQITEHGALGTLKVLEAWRLHLDLMGFEFLAA